MARGRGGGEARSAPVQTGDSPEKVGARHDSPEKVGARHDSPALLQFFFQ